MRLIVILSGQKIQEKNGQWEKGRAMEKDTGMNSWRGKNKRERMLDPRV